MLVISTQAGYSCATHGWTRNGCTIHVVCLGGRLLHVVQSVPTVMSSHFRLKPMVVLVPKDCATTPDPHRRYDDIDLVPSVEWALSGPVINATPKRDQDVCDILVVS